MDQVRFGLALRALRRRRAWTQDQLAARAACHGRRSSASSAVASTTSPAGPSARSRLPSGPGMTSGSCGRARGWTGSWTRTMRHCRAGRPLASRRGMGRHTGGDVRVRWPARLSRRAGIPPSTGTLLIVEVKSVVPDMQAMLSGIDRKTRAAPILARDRGWRVGSVSRTARRAGRPDRAAARSRRIARPSTPRCRPERVRSAGGQPVTERAGSRGSCSCRGRRPVSRHRVVATRD